MESTIVMLLQFLPFLLILWLANMAGTGNIPRPPAGICRRRLCCSD